MTGKTIVFDSVSPPRSREELRCRLSKSWARDASVTARTILGDDGCSSDLVDYLRGSVLELLESYDNNAVHVDDDAPPKPQGGAS